MIYDTTPRYSITAAYTSNDLRITFYLTVKQIFFEF